MFEEVKVWVLYKIKDIRNNNIVERQQNIFLPKIPNMCEWIQLEDTIASPEVLDMQIHKVIYRQNGSPHSFKIDLECGTVEVCRIETLVKSA